MYNLSYRDTNKASTGQNKMSLRL